ncbi:MAG: ABC transporter permease subunit [Roseburia sp.]
MEILLQLEKPLPGLFYSCIATVTYSALFCLISMLDSNKARAAIIGLLIAVFLVMGGLATSNGLAEPEFTTRMAMNAEGAYEIMENVPNSKYLSGTKRVVYQCIDALLPSCQALRPILSNAAYPGYIPACALGWTAVLTVCGFLLFRRKDLK